MSDRYNEEAAKWFRDTPERRGPKGVHQISLATLLRSIAAEARAAGREEMRTELINFLRDEGERLFEADDDERAEVIGWVLECVSAIGTKPKEP